MNTQQPPRSRSSYSGGRQNPRATSGAGSRCGGSAGLPAPPSLALSQPSEDSKSARPLDRQGTRILCGAPSPRGIGAGTSRSPREIGLAPPAEARRRARNPGHEPGALARRHPTPLDTLLRRQFKRAPSPALKRGALPCTPSRRSRVPGRLRAQPAPNRSWAAGSAPPAGQAPGGEPERSRGPAAWSGRGRRGCEPGHLRAGSGEPHGQEHVQRRSMLDGAGALLAVPPRGDFAVQLLSRSHAERAGVAVLSHAQRPAIAQEGDRAGSSGRAGGRPGAGEGARGPGAGQAAAAEEAALGASPSVETDASW